MFAQVIQGRTTDRAGVRARFEEWDKNLKAGAEGFLGSTAGVSDDGELIAIARFESEEAARRNSDRPEQGRWWAETEALLEGETRFYDCTEVELSWGGGSDDAGFVQVIQGRLKDESQKERFRAMEEEAEGWMRENRPDVIGGVTAWQGPNFSNFVYFTSEQEARAGEQKQPPPGDGDGGDWMEYVEDLKFIDVREPYFSSP
jgi:hypothetical protein